MGAIVLRWNADFLHFLGFSCLFASWACLGHFNTNKNIKNTVEIPVIKAQA
jgi:hypothetical protein